MQNFERLAPEVTRLNFYTKRGKAGISSLPDPTLLVNMSPPKIRDVLPLIYTTAGAFYRASVASCRSFSLCSSWSPA